MTQNIQSLSWHYNRVQLHLVETHTAGSKWNQTTADLL